MWQRIRDEPALAVEVVRLGLVTAVLFGLELSDEQTLALVALSSAVLSLFVRSRVRPA